MPGLKILTRVAATRPEWARFGLIYEKNRFAALVTAQNRAVLDSLVDHDFALAALKRVRQYLYLSSEHQLRVSAMSKDDVELSVAEAFVRYGGEVVEDVLEHGSRNVAPKP